MPPFRVQLAALAERHGERLLHTPNNTISMAITLSPEEGGAIPTMALLTMALLTMALLTMAKPTLTLTLTLTRRPPPHCHGRVTLHPSHLGLPYRRAPRLLKAASWQRYSSAAPASSDGCTGCSAAPRTQEGRPSRTAQTS